jgi:hypothetical protein
LYVDMSGSLVSTRCLYCTADTYSTAGETFRTTCPAGQYSTLNSSVCTFCTAGHVSSTATTLSQKQCIICQYTTTMGHLTSTSCMGCSVMQYTSENGTVTCTLCAAGEYLATTGASESTSSIVCDAVKYAISTGAVKCTPCASDQYVTVTGTATGLYLTLTSTSCTGCPKTIHMALLLIFVAGVVVYIRCNTKEPFGNDTTVATLNTTVMIETPTPRLHGAKVQPLQSSSSPVNVFHTSNEATKVIEDPAMQDKLRRKHIAATRKIQTNSTRYWIRLAMSDADQVQHQFASQTSEVTRVKVLFLFIADPSRFVVPLYRLILPYLLCCLVRTTTDRVIKIVLRCCRSDHGWCSAADYGRAP